jgi:hypothetical protein
MANVFLKNIIFLKTKTQEGINPDLLLDIYKNFYPDISCIICCAIVNDPEQCKTCQSLFCKYCIKKWIGQGKSCPTRCHYQPQKLNLTILKLLNKVKLWCEYKCGQIISYENYFNHTARDCQFSKVKCKSCSLEMQNCLITSHLDSCQMVLLVCELCNEEIRRKEMKSHLSICPELLIKCQKCLKLLKQKDFEIHYKGCSPNLCEKCKFQTTKTRQSTRIRISKTDNPKMNQKAVTKTKNVDCYISL